MNIFKTQIHKKQYFAIQAYKEYDNNYKIILSYYNAKDNLGGHQNILLAFSNRGEVILSPLQIYCLELENTLNIQKI